MKNSYPWPPGAVFELASPMYCGGVFEQLARYTTRYQESDLHLGLYSSYSSYNFCLLYFYSTFPTLLY